MPWRWDGRVKTHLPAQDQLKRGAAGLEYLMAGGGPVAVIAALGLATQTTLKGHLPDGVSNALVFRD
ncbi:MAG: hypothetical protein ACREP9_11620 [Candidatus Dormibacteraceae bacterium]